MVNRVNLSLSRSRRRRPRRSQPRSLVTVTARPTIRRARTARRRLRRRAPGMQLASRMSDRAIVSHPYFRQYLCTIENPFECPPIKLGWGTLQPTQLYTYVLRGVITANADGSFAIAQFPTGGSVTPGLSFCSAGAGTATWTHGSAYTNGTAISGSLNQMRVVSGGIRVTPQIAATAAPGVLYAGSIPSVTQANLETATINTLAGSQYVKLGYGSLGASAIILPNDDSAFEFSNANVGGGTGNLYSSSSPLIFGIGLPASCSVYYEAVLNIEGISAITAASSALTNPGLQPWNGPTLADAGATSTDHVLNLLAHLLPCAGCVRQAASIVADTITSVASRISNTFSAPLPNRLPSGVSETNRDFTQDRRNFYSRIPVNSLQPT
jgi:hypothetical protein